MALPQGINFRDTAAFVTDGVDEYAQLPPPSGGNYPTTTPQGNTVGWEGTPWSAFSVRNRSSAVDRRLAGTHVINQAVVMNYRIDLPKPGRYAIRFAGGDVIYNNAAQAELFDSSASLGVLASGTTPAGSFRDATNAVLTAANWPTQNNAVEREFATTICRVAFGAAGASGYGVVHLHVESAGAPPVVDRTLVVGAAALGIVGGQVVMRVSRRLRAEPAGLMLGAGQVSMRAARRIAVAPAGLSIDVGDVAARASRRMAVGRAAMSLDPGQVAMLAARRLGVQPTALQLIGGDVGMRAARRLGVAPAGLVLAGSDISVRAARRLAVAPAALVLVGGQVEMQYVPNPVPGSYTLSVSAAAMTLGGGEMRMRVSRRLVVAPARLELAAGAVRALVGRRLLVSPAALAVGAGPVGMVAHRRLPVAAAALLLAPGEVMLRYNSQIEYARAPAGPGYAPQRVTVMARPAQTGGFRPPATQETIR